MGTLRRGVGTRDLSREMSKCRPLAREQALGSERYDTSLWMCKIMLM